MIRVKKFSNNRFGQAITPFYMMVEETGVPFGSRYKSEEAAQKQADKRNEQRRKR